MLKKLLLLTLFVTSVRAAAQNYADATFSIPDVVLEPGNQVSDIVYSPDGSILASAAADTITLWDTSTGEAVQTLTAENAVQSLKYSPDGTKLIAAIYPNRLLVWDATLENEVGAATFRLEITDFDIAADGDTMALILDRDTNDYRVFTRIVVTTSLSAALNGDMVLRELSSSINIRGDWAGLDFDSTGQYLAAGVWNISMTSEVDNASVYVWDVRQNATPLLYGADFVSPIVDVQFSPDESMLIAGTYNMLAWEIGQPDEIAYQTVDGQLETGVSISGDFVASAQMDFFPMNELEYARSRVTLRNWRTGETLTTFERETPPYERQSFGGEGPNLSRTPVALNADASQLAIVDPGGVISLWNLDVLLEAEFETPIDVFAYCNELIDVPPVIAADQPVRIIWSWFATTVGFVRNHMQVAEYELTLDGDPITDYRRSAIQRDPLNNDHWTLYYRADVGILEPGTHIVTYRLTWRFPISDGIDEFGLGTAQEENTGECVFTVE